MTMVKTLSCPHGPISSDFNGKLKTSFRPKRAIHSSVSTDFPRTFWLNLPNSSRGTRWSRWMGGQENLINLSVQIRSPATKFGTRWSRDTVRSDMSTTPNSGRNAWLGKFLKLEKPQGDGDSQKTAVVDVQIRFSLSEPKSLADAASRFAPPWFKLLKRIQPVLPLLLQSGGGGNRDGDFYNRLGYGGDDDSDNSRHRKKRLMLVYQWWAVWVALTSLIVWAMGAYSGIPQRTKFSVSQFVDGVLWLGLMWCVAAFFLWTARMLISLTPSGQGHRNLFRAQNAFSSGREFVLTSKFDEWMAQNVVAVPGLVISLFLVCDLIHYGKNLNLVSRAKSESSRIFQLLISPRVGGPPRASSLFSRGKKWRQGTSSAKRRRS